MRSTGTMDGDGATAGRPANAAGCIFWGKYDEATGRCLPLASHCLDVALVFRGLAELPAIRRALETAGERRLDDADIDRLAVLAALHDLGKANLGFQRKVFDPAAPRAGHVRELEPLFQDDALRRRFLEALGAQELLGWFDEEETLEDFLLAVWSHHGRPVAFRDSRIGAAVRAAAWWRPDGGHDPMGAVAAVVAAAREAFPAAFEPAARTLPGASRFQHLYAGLVMLADWLGSHPHWFPVDRIAPDRRLAVSRRAAAGQLAAVGLDTRALQSKFAAVPGEFRSRFGLEPRPLQSAVSALDPADPANRLLIAEAETGSGKTEAALQWFATLFAAGRVDGLYFALPTRVAARELYERVAGVIARWFPDPAHRPVVVLAVPGYAQVDGVPAERLLPDPEHSRWTDDDRLRARERQWAAEHPKRFLAATVAVGTVDQALLGAVQTAHAHMRAACLARSLLVVDEVHASDTYMARLLEHLLRLHLGVGGHAMLLSATLGAHAHTRFLSAAGAATETPPLETAVRRPYPAVTRADGTLHFCGAAGTRRRVVFDLRPQAFRPEELVPELAGAMHAGARVLVVLNTVDRAIRMLRAFEARPELEPRWLFACEGLPCPHHGRFAPADRAVLDRAVSARFGKDGPRGPVILIGTQTLEQSLDLDADWLVTDLAPADVLLQRVGRLHRHRRTRPDAFREPRCTVLVPGHGSLEAGLDDRGRIARDWRVLGYGSVYADLRALELTRRRLAERPVVALPEDCRPLVEAVTHPEALAALHGDRWDAHAREIEGGELAQAVAAAGVTAVFDRPFREVEFHEAVARIRTRLGTDRLQLPLARPVRSPFGAELRELVIPGHMAPEQPDAEITVERADGGELLLRCGGRRYRYTRYGLERIADADDEPPD